MQCSKKTIIGTFLCLVGTFVVTFQVIGIIEPEWFTYDAKIRTQQAYSPDTVTSISVSIGLWFTKSCISENNNLATTQTKCATVTIDDLIKEIEMGSQKAAMKEGELKILSDFLPQKVLTVVGVVIALFGLFITGAYLRSSPKERTVSLRITEISCIVCWAISAAVVITAVKIQLDRNAEFEKTTDAQISALGVKDSVTFSLNSPTAAIISGVGGSLSAVMAVLITLMLLFGKKTGLPPYSQLKANELV